MNTPTEDIREALGFFALTAAGGSCDAARACRDLAAALLDLRRADLLDGLDDRFAAAMNAVARGLGIDEEVTR